MTFSCQPLGDDIQLSISLWDRYHVEDIANASQCFVNYGGLLFETLRYVKDSVVWKSSNQQMKLN